MNNAIMYEYYSYGDSNSDKEDNLDGNLDPMDAKLKKLMEEKGIVVDEVESEQSQKERRLPSDTDSENEEEREF